MKACTAVCTVAWRLATTAGNIKNRGNVSNTSHVSNSNKDAGKCNDASHSKDIGNSRGNSRSNNICIRNSRDTSNSQGRKIKEYLQQTKANNISSSFEF
jgi:hypothetical protein